MYFDRDEDALKTSARGVRSQVKGRLKDLGASRNAVLACGVAVALVIGGLVGAGIVASATPVTTETSEYAALQGRLDRTAAAKDDDIEELREQVSELRVAKGKLEEAANEVERAQAAADAREVELVAREQAVGTAEAAKKS